MPFEESNESQILSQIEQREEEEEFTLKELTAEINTELEKKEKELNNIYIMLLILIYVFAVVAGFPQFKNSL